MQTTFDHSVARAQNWTWNSREKIPLGKPAKCLRLRGIVINIAAHLHEVLEWRLWLGVVQIEMLVTVY